MVHFGPEWKATVCDYIDVTNRPTPLGRYIQSCTGDGVRAKGTREGVGSTRPTVSFGGKDGVLGLGVGT